MLPILYLFRVLLCRAGSRQFLTPSKMLNDAVTMKFATGN